MIAIAKIYALTSVTIRGDIMLIPAWYSEIDAYPFDLQIIIPNFLINSNNPLIQFLRFLNLAHFHYKGRLIISSSILIDTNPLLDELNKIYRKFWNLYSNILEVPKRRQLVERELLKWSSTLPNSTLGKFIHQYYSHSLKRTDWQQKLSLWRSLRHKTIDKKKYSAKKLAKLKEKYVEVWFQYFEKINFSAHIKSQFPNFIETINQLTFQDILPEKHRSCPACEMDLSSYPPDIQYCPQCGYALLEPAHKYCENCGAELVKDARFCGRCGKKIE